MSLDKAIKSGKEHRKPYFGAQAIDPQCRCGGTCIYCQNNRQYKNIKRKMRLDVDIKELKQYNEL